jgi:hypothetical protein
LHHSSPAPRKRPRKIWPSVSRRIKAISIVPASTPKRVASSSTVTGPLDSNQPRKISENASSRRSGIGCAAVNAAISGVATASG